MKKNLILLGIASVLGLFVYFYEIQGEKERQETKQYESSLMKMELDEIQSVTLIQRQNNLIKYNRVENSWEIIEPVRSTVEESAINGNQSAFINANIKRKLLTTSDKLKNFGLEKPNLEVIIESKDGRRLDLLIGDEAATRGDLFVAFRDSNIVFITSNDVKTQAEKTLFDLRDKKIAHFNKDDVRQIELITKEHSILLEKIADNWVMQTPDLPVEQTRVNGFLSSLTNYSAKAFVAESFEDEVEYGFDKPAARVRLSLGEEMALKEIVIGNVVFEDNDDLEFYGYESGRPAVFSIRESTKEDVSHAPFYFQDKQLLSFDKEALQEIRISGAYQITLAPQDTLGWYIHSDSSFNVEDSDMNRLSSGLEGVSAAELVTANPDGSSDYGLKQPFLEVVITDTLGISTGFIIGDSNEDNDRYASSKNLERIYLVRISQVERITDWIEEILDSEEKTNTAP